MFLTVIAGHHGAVKAVTLSTIDTELRSLTGVFSNSDQTPVRSECPLPACLAANALNLPRLQRCIARGSYVVEVCILNPKRIKP